MPVCLTGTYLNWGEKELDLRQTGSRVHMGAMTQPYAWTRCSPVLQISLQFALHFAQRALSWHTFLCIIKALVPLDTIVLASLKDLSYHKKKEEKFIHL